MGKAEAGSLKALSNSMKSKGLTRLRWYCSLCGKANRDENAFKMHCQSPSHLRAALEAGQNFKGVEEENSKMFLQDFLSLLKTSHGEKEIHGNRFYNEYIARKDHIHLNSTKWPNLTAFLKYLGREGVCRVEEKDEEAGMPGLYISWIDDSPEALRRRDEVRRKALAEKGDEEREKAMLKQQIARAQKDAAARGMLEGEGKDGHELKLGQGEKIKLSFGAKSSAPPPPKNLSESPAGASSSTSPNAGVPTPESQESNAATDSAKTKDEEVGKPAEPKPVSLKFGTKPLQKNVFKNAFAGGPKKVMAAQPKKISEAERIMKEEIERKRAREAGGGQPNKRPRF